MKRLIYVCLITTLLAPVSPARAAGTKEEIMRLQADVLALQNQVRIMQQSLNERADGLRSLINQLNDQSAQTNQILSKMALSLDAQAAGDKGGDQVVLQEIRNLSGKLDDQSTRISALAQAVADMKVQAKEIPSRVFQQDGASGVSPDAVYSEAYNDLVQGNFDLAIEGFAAVTKNFPASAKADDALYNTGEAYYNQNRLPQAVAAFTRVLNEYPDGDMVASALFKRGKAELLMQERDNAIADFKTVVSKYPNAAEAGLAAGELQGLGVSLNKPKTPVKRPVRKP